MLIRKCSCGHVLTTGQYLCGHGYADSKSVPDSAAPQESAAPEPVAEVTISWAGAFRIALATLIVFAFAGGISGAIVAMSLSQP